MRYDTLGNKAPLFPELSEVGTVQNTEPDRWTHVEESGTLSSQRVPFSIQNASAVDVGNQIMLYWSAAVRAGVTLNELPPSGADVMGVIYVLDSNPNSTIWSADLWLSD